MATEFERIKRFIAAADASRPSDVSGPSATSGQADASGHLDAACGLTGDDAASLIVPAGERLVVSTDQSIEGIHFEREWLSWEEIGYRAVASALSDLAAMAARPLAALVSIAVPPELDEWMLESVASGMGECLRGHGTVLAGGDLSASPGAVFIDVVALGHAADPARRSGARIGDELWVSGELGGPAAAVLAWQQGLEPDRRARRKFVRPEPRLELARRLVRDGSVHAMIDVSDGLAGDGRHLSAASGVCLRFDLPSLPLSEVLEPMHDRELAWRLAVQGGEDYELLLAVAPHSLDAIRPIVQRESGVALTRVGEVVAGAGVTWVQDDGHTWTGPEVGFEHFGET